MNSEFPRLDASSPSVSSRAQADRLGQDLGHLAGVFDATPVGAGVWSADRRLVYANPVLCGLLGRPSADLVGSALADHLAPDDVETVDAKLADIWAGRRNYLECELLGREDAGAHLRLRAFVAAVYTPGGEPGYLISQVFSFAGPDHHDERIRRLVQHAPALMWLTDRDGNPRLGNRACFDFIGVHQPAGSIGREWPDAVHPVDLAAAAEHIAAPIARHQPFDFVARSRRRDGEWRWLHHRAEPIFDVAGNFEGYAGASVDVTEIERAHRDLHDSLKQFADLTDGGPLPVARIDAEGRVTYLNDRWSELVPDPQAQLTGFGWQDVIEPELVERIVEAATASLETRRPFRLEVRGRLSTLDRQDADFWGELRVAPIFTEDGRSQGFAATLIDVSSAAQAARRADRLAQVLDASSDLVFIARPSGAITYANDAAVVRLGVRVAPDDADPSSQDDRVEGAFLWDLLDPESRDLYYDVVEPVLRAEGVWRGELTFRADEPVPVSALLLAQTDDLGRLESISAVARDITDLKDAENRLRHLATHDALTDMPNRTLLYDRLGQALARFHRLGHGVALFFCDLDHFKPINDERGHHVGDVVLRTVAARIGGVIRATDTAARVGGDEFVVLAEGVDDLDLLLSLGRRLIRSVSEPIELDDDTVTVGMSIGLVLAADGRDDVDTLLSLADRAMYRAKAAGRGRIELLRDRP